jgi:hypothetical protein
MLGRNLAAVRTTSARPISPPAVNKNEDPLALELRNRAAAGPGQRGFDIGMAAAERQTLPGPGKDRIRGSLPPDEQKGFNTAVSFSLERNRNLEFAAKGSAIATADPVVAKARALNPSVFYWLGFDVATGIFGDVALGGAGHTSEGPGSPKICDSLSPDGQKGFKAAMDLYVVKKHKAARWSLLHAACSSRTRIYLVAGLHAMEGKVMATNLPEITFISGGGPSLPELLAVDFSVGSGTSPPAISYRLSFLRPTHPFPSNEYRS